MDHFLGYARVSTTDQQPQLQIDALERTGPLTGGPGSVHRLL
jgi:DNA invertase Pin-like site-specific DNA recombinase